MTTERLGLDMNFIRPEIRDGFWRWREALVGAAIAIVSLLVAVSSTGILQVIGTSLSLVGALLMFAGIQKTRFRVKSDGPGMVEVDEGQVTYFGPYDGGSVSVRSLEKLELEPNYNGGAAWVLTEPGAQPLHIPTDAAGADELFDVFASLDGIRTERMLAELRKSPDQRVVIWQAETRQLH